MGERGPAPRPNRLKVLAGESRPSQLRREIKATPGEPPCPQWLDPEARKIWQAVVPELRGMGTLSVVDQGALASYAIALAQYREAVEKRPDVTDRQAMLGLAKIEARVLASGRELGLSPASRARMGTKQDAKQETNWLDTMMNQQPVRRGS